MRNMQLTGLAAHLVEDGLVDVTFAKASLPIINEQNISFSRYLIKCGMLSSQEILDYCANKFGLPIFNLNNYAPICSAEPIIKPELIYKHRVIPLARDQYGILLGIADPTDQAAIAAISFHTGSRIRLALVCEEELEKIIEDYYRSTILHAKLESALATIPSLNESLLQAATILHDDEPISNFVNQLLHEAIKKNVSDIHIEPYEHQCRIRFRQDGLLYEAAHLPLHLANRVSTRLKILANLNIAERRLPQDGRILIEKEYKIDIRINTCPTLYGEKIVLRILHAKNLDLDISMLGLNTEQKNIFLQKLSHPQGLILVTGPTGSGKTLTLYSALHYLNQLEKNIASVEDPIEIELKGINQVNVNPAIGLDFSSILRALLRQDPDIIMLGEIRDKDTADTAIHAAQTGHLVLSTLHTNSAIETIIRLQNIGIATYNLANSLSLVIAQRLVRKLCPDCRQPEMAAAKFAHEQPKYRALGCTNCHQGYKNRTGIFELLPITEQIKHAIIAGTQISDPPMSLFEAGLEKVCAGTTSLAEIMRVIGNREMKQH